jgi:acyl transferase domain-containing protein
MACEFAGDIHSPADLWRALEESRDVGSAIPRDRFDLESYCAHMLNQDNEEQLQQKLLRAGYFLANKHWDTFEPSFFGLSDAEAGSIDPCHRLLMVKFVHLLEDAGYTLEKMNGSRTSVHIGQFSTDHLITSFGMQPEHRSRFHGLNSLLFNAAARLSYHFNLQGPNVSLDVACSSSLEAVHLAVQSLRSNEVDMAVCGGVNGLYTAENFLYSSLIGAQSPDGRSRSFSANANGYAKGTRSVFRGLIDRSWFALQAMVSVSCC